MRTFFAVFVQFGLFLLTFLVGSLFLHPFHVQTTLSSDAAHTRVFVWDGLLLMLALYGLVLVLEAVTKRIRSAAGWSTIAVVLAGALGLAMRFGFLITER